MSRYDRDKEPLQKKLAYISNDSKKLGDNLGAWYHFFGIRLYGLVRPYFMAASVAEIESLGSWSSLATSGSPWLPASARIR